MCKKGLLVLMMVILALAACNGQPTGFGDLSAGEALFNQQTIGSTSGCSLCHSTEPDGVRVGPSLAGIANRAGERVEGQSSEEYLRTSILEPDAYVVEGFTKGVMYQQYQQVLTDQQVEDLLAYMLTLK